MKNRTLTLAALILTGALALTGCAKTSTEDNTNATANQSDSKQTTSEIGEEQDTNSKAEDVFSKLNTTDLDGNPVDGSIFQDKKLTLVNAWNIGCTPCVEEIPYLQKISEEYAEKGVAVKGLYFSFGEDVGEDEMSQVKEVLSNASATYSQLLLSKEMYENSTMQEVMAFPTTFIVDSNGTIIDKLEGSKDYNGWKETVEKYLSQVQ